jgi:hypothetical protein
MDATNIPIAMFNKLQATPNTKLWDRLKSEGRLKENVGSGDSLGGDLNFVPLRSEFEIQREFMYLWDHVYDPSNFLKRTYNYYLTMRPTRKAMAKQQGLVIPLGQSQERPPLRRVVFDLNKLIRLSWRQGVVSKTRFQYWKQFFGILRKNPSRFIQYLTTCAMGEDMYEIRRKFLVKIGLRENKFSQ